MLTAAECLQIIRSSYPDLPIRKYSYNGTGQNNDVLVVNDELVFRFPRTPHGARQLRIEAAVLAHLQSRVTLQVPNPIYLNLGGSDGGVPGRAREGTKAGSPGRTASPLPGIGQPRQAAQAAGNAAAQPVAWWQRPTGQSQNIGIQLTSWQRPLGLRPRGGPRSREAGRPAPGPEDRPGLRGADGKLPWERDIFSNGLPWSRERGDRRAAPSSGRAAPSSGRAAPSGGRAASADRRPAFMGAFVGYRWIPGEPLWRDSLLGESDPKVVQTWADQLGRFLRELHETPIAEDLEALLPRYDTRARWADFYDRIEAKVFRYIGPDARLEIARSFEAYLAEPLNFSHPLTLVHGDFGPGNILLDRPNSRVSGVIDFGSAGLDDPAVDLAALIGPYGYGEAFLRRFAKIYAIPPEDLARARFYASTFALQDAVYGIEHGDAQAFESGIAAYR